MLILITSRCKMGCIHCMSDCKPEGEDMSFSTFADAIDFSLRRAFPTPIMYPAANRPKIHNSSKWSDTHCR